MPDDLSMNAGTTMRILVVDDSEDALDLTEGALLSAGYADMSPQLGLGGA